MLPGNEEWKHLVCTAGGEDIAGAALKAESFRGIDCLGFNALPGGYRLKGDIFYDAGDYGYWWSASESNASLAYNRYMSYRSDYAFWTNYGKSSGFSVRCCRLATERR
jgi:uncharacterized protein (TIGR02145 family)